MKVVSRYCDSCGIKIPAAEITDGTALKYDESYYCKDCKGEILPLIEQKAGKEGAKSAPAAKGGKTASGSKAAVGGNGASAARQIAPPAKSSSGSGSGSRPAAGSKPGGATRPGSATPRKTLPPAKTRKPAAPADEEPSASSDEPAEGGKKRLPLVPIAIGAVVVILIVVAILLSRTRTPEGGGEHAVRPDPTPASANNEVNKELYAKADALAGGKAPADLRAAIKALNVARIELKPSPNQNDLAVKIDARVEQLRSDLNDLAGKAFNDAVEKAQAKAKTDDFAGAIGEIKAIPDDFRDSPWWKNNARAELLRLEAQLAARREAEPLLKKAEELAKQQQYLAAAGVLDAYDQETHRDSDWTKRVQKALAQVLDLNSAAEEKKAKDILDAQAKAQKDAEAKALAEKRKKEDARVAGLSWEKLLGDDLFTWHMPDPEPKTKGTWAVDKATKELTGKSGAAVKGTDYGAIAGTGKPDWKDCIYEFGYKVVKGSFKVGVRVDPKKGFGEALPELKADGQWHVLQVSVRGDGADAEVLVGTDGGVLGKVETKDLDASDRGGIAFVLLPDSTIVFRDLKVKVISK